MRYFRAIDGLGRIVALFGVGHPRWGDFEKSALKSPETRMNTKKNRGDIYFVTPSWCKRRDLNSKTTFAHICKVQ